MFPGGRKLLFNFTVKITKVSPLSLSKSWSINSLTVFSYSSSYGVRDRRQLVKPVWKYECLWCVGGSTWGEPTLVQVQTQSREIPAAQLRLHYTSQDNHILLTALCQFLLYIQSWFKYRWTIMLHFHQRSFFSYNSLHFVQHNSHAEIAKTISCFNGIKSRCEALREILLTWLLSRYMEVFLCLTSKIACFPEVHLFSSNS